MPGFPGKGRARPMIWGALALVAVIALFVALKPSGDEERTSATATAQRSTVPATDTLGTPPTTEAAPTTSEAAPEEPSAMRIRITVRGGRAVGGIQRPRVSRGDDVVLVVRADAPEVVHLHGYDREAPVGPNAPAQIGFRADQPGRFELELEKSGVLIAELTVSP